MPDRDVLAGTLEAGCHKLKLSVDEICLQRLLDYLQLLHKWNKAYNLTAVRELQAMLSRHILDSLSIAPWIDQQRYIDVGTGPGLPGIPLALLYPHKHFSLLDSNGKKTRFLQQVKTELGIENIEIYRQRAEQLPTVDKLYDGVISRAFTELADMVSLCHKLLADGGCFLAMKGQYPERELSRLQKPYKVDACHPLQVPDVDEPRHLVIIKRDHNDTQPQ